MRLAPIFLLITILAGCAQAETPPAGEYRLSGQVIAVEDGDTLTIRGERHGKRHRIRLSDIDAPEIGHSGRPGQPFGQAAADTLRGMALGRPATAQCFEADGYGRHVCHVYVGAAQLNAAMLQLGMAVTAERAAWIRNLAAAAIEAEARAAGRGLWAAPDPVSPWAWRRGCWGAAKICPGAE